MEYLCDLLCFRLDLAFFVACVNSGRSWTSKASMLFRQKEHIKDEKDTGDLDTFVENFILERLAVQSPMRVSMFFSPSNFIMLEYLSTKWFSCNYFNEMHHKMDI